MRRLFFLIVCSLFVTALIVKGIQYDTGYVQITYGHWLIETNLWVLLALTIMAAAGIYLIFGLLRGVKKGAGGVLHWNRIRPKKKANQQSESGLLAFLEGDWDSAQKLLTQSAKHARMPIVNLLAAANAAHQQGNHKQSAEILKRAHQLTGGSELAASLTQARLHIEVGRFEAALAVLVRLQNKYPKHPYVAQLLVKVYTELEDWEQLVRCFEGEQSKLIELDEEFERSIWAKLFASYAKKFEASQGKDEITEALAELWKRVPSKYRFEEHVIYAYTRELLRVCADYEAEVILRKALDNHWSENLADAYGRTQGKDRTEQLLHAEKWLKERPNSPRLLLALGRLSLRCELWGKAAEYLAASQKQQASLEAVAELYRLFTHLGKPEKETEKLLNNLMNHIQLPELPQPRLTRSNH